MNGNVFNPDRRETATLVEGDADFATILDLILIIRLFAMVKQWRGETTTFN